MNTLIIYDNDGYIISSVSGNYRIPNGIPYIETEIPPDKILQSVDVETKTPILIDRPKTEIEILQEQNAMLENAILDLANIVGGV